MKLINEKLVLDEVVYLGEVSGDTIEELVTAAAEKYIEDITGLVMAALKRKKKKYERLTLSFDHMKVSLIGGREETEAEKNKRTRELSKKEQRELKILTSLAKKHPEIARNIIEGENV